MLDLCPACERPLRNGTLSGTKHIQSDADKFKSGEIDLAEFDKRSYKELTRICTNPTCTNFAGNPDDPFTTRNHTYQRNGVEVTEPENVVKLDLANPRTTVEVHFVTDN